MELVVNKCYGGFGISVEALKLLVIRGAACVSTHTPKKYYGGETRKDWSEKWERDFEKYKNIGDGFKAHPDGFNLYKDGILYGFERDYELRTDKDLIEVVRLLGDSANGMFAELKIVDIPDGINWEIDDYDGIETVREAHRTW